MINQKNDSHNFWSGYSAGMISGAVLMFAFGTKKGRETILKIIEHTDTVEHNIGDILERIQKKVSSFESKTESKK